jgi:hypothetical protein
MYTHLLSNNFEHKLGSDAKYFATPTLFYREWVSTIASFNH